MGFWDKHLPPPGGPAPHYPERRPAAPPPPPAVAPVPTQYAPESAVQQGSVEDEASLSAALQNDAYQPQKAIAHRTETGRCPACDSPNWFTGAVVGQSPRPHCYDCGYPMVQTGSGMGALGHVANAGPVRPATQVQTPNPEPGGF